ncbi:HU family DNA-binding protein [Cochlodiniinecator piscidefendens]|uniref:HU family DNA-binding protein n=1 Tax=Cochlodiniinecator piscidefendens TaxID=2715756 RepID=UPI00140C7562|nr:HU family DNA-binding protein [Cochlodiniinecator piscidefendens]
MTKKARKSSVAGVSAPARKTTSQTPTPLIEETPIDAAISAVVDVADEISTKPAVKSIKKKELLEKICARAECKPKDARPILEALLEVLGETLDEGYSVPLAPLGKLVVTREKHDDNGHVLFCKIRRTKKSLDDDIAPIAEAAE